MPHKIVGHPMRRKQRQVQDPRKIEEILRSQKICRIAMCDEGEPYIIPVTYGYEDGSLYIHCAKRGRKLDIIRKNNLVGFEIEADVILDQPAELAEWKQFFKCVVGVGRAVILETREDIARALDILAAQFDLDEGEWSQVCGEGITDWEKVTGAFRIDIVKMTCKQSNYDSWATSGTTSTEDA